MICFEELVNYYLLEKISKEQQKQENIKPFIQLKKYLFNKWENKKLNKEQKIQKRLEYCRFNYLIEMSKNFLVKSNITENYLAKVICETLNCRSGAGTNYPIVRQIHKGTVITIVATDGNWLQAKMGYWVHKNYMEYIRKV